EIIPYVVKTLAEARKGDEVPFEWPATCPTCGSPALREPEAVYYFCTGGATCSAQVQERLKSYADLDRMDIAGLGDQLAEQLVSAGLIKTVTDLYRLKLEDLLKLERMGKKSAQNLLASIEASKQRGLTRLLSGLSIGNVGVEVAEWITAQYTSIDDLV